MELAKILLVDDYHANLLALGATLEPLGLELVCARSGAEALARVEEHDFALILLDVQMASMDGFETATLLRARGRARETPIIFLTAIHVDSSYARRGFSLGAVDYITKPFDPDLLRDKVKSFVMLYERGREIQRQAMLLQEREREALQHRAAREAAEKALQTRDLFISVLGHDLRTPLAAIHASAQLVLRDELKPLHASALQRVVASAERMDRMIRDLLDFARGHFGGGIPVQRAEADLGDLCERVLTELTPVASGRTIRLDKQGQLGGRWDVERVTQALSNLVANAVQHASGDEIAVCARAEGEAVVVEVTNPGAPLPAQLRERLFEPFHKGDRYSRGLGLGLYIAREVVRAHGGSIALDDGGGLIRIRTRWPRAG